MRKQRKTYQNGGPITPNYQTLGNIKFDSNKARTGEYGQLIVKDENSGKDFGVVRTTGGPIDPVIERTLPEFTVVSAKKDSKNYKNLQALKNIDDRDNLNGSLYQIWEGSGKPNIILHNGVTYRAHFKPSTNEVHIGSIQDYRDKNLKTGRLTDLMGEFPHALQNKDGQFTNGRKVNDWIKSPYIGDYNNSTYQSQYDTKGTIEYDAHQVIQPKLTRYLQGLKTSKIDVPSYATGGYLQNNQMRKRKNYAGGGNMDMYSMLASKGTELAGDYYSAFNYKPQLGPEKSQADYNKDILMKGIQGGGISALPSIIRMFKDKNTIVSGSPGTYQQGGPIQGVPAQGPININPRRKSSIYTPLLDSQATIPYAPTTNTWIDPLGVAKQTTVADLYNQIKIRDNGDVSNKSKSKDRFREYASGGKVKCATGGSMDEDNNPNDADDQQLSNNSFQVKGNSNVTDGNSYPEYNANLDHNEVVDSKAKFVFSDDLKIPGTKRSFAQAAKPLYSKVGKLEDRKDPISQATTAQFNKQINDLAMTQEQLATMMGLRNNQGNNRAGGGKLDGPGDRIVVYNDTREQILYDNSTGQYFVKSHVTGKERSANDVEATEYTSMFGNAPMNPVGEGLKSLGGIGNQDLANQKYYNSFGGENAYDRQTDAMPKSSQPPYSGTTKNVISTPAQISAPSTVWVDPATPQPINPKRTSGQSPTRPTRNSTSSTPTKGGLPWDGFDVAQFQQWYNTMPGGSKLSADGKWGPATKKAYEATAYDYMKSTGKNTVNSIGPMSVVSPDGSTYTDVQPVDGKLLPSSIGTPQKLPQIYDTTNLPSKSGYSFNLTKTPSGSNIYDLENGDPFATVVSNKLNTTPQASQIASGMSALEAKYSPANTSTSNRDYTQGFTPGDIMQGIEVGSKFFNIGEGPEQEGQLLNTTPITKTGYDVNSALYQNQRNYRNTLNGIGTSSAPQRRALSNQLLATKLNSDNQVLSQYQNMNNEATVNYENRLSQQRQGNIASAFRTNDLNAANRGEYDQAQQNAFTSLGNFGEALNRRKMSQASLDILRVNYPDIYESVMGDINGIKKKSSLQLKVG